MCKLCILFPHLFYSNSCFCACEQLKRGIRACSCVACMYSHSPACALEPPKDYEYQVHCMLPPHYHMMCCNGSSSGFAQHSEFAQHSGSRSGRPISRQPLVKLLVTLVGLLDVSFIAVHSVKFSHVLCLSP